MSPGAETIIQNAMERRNLPALYGALPLLKELDAETIREIVDEVEWISLPGGSVLYEAGQEADALYIVINGALGCHAAGPSGTLRAVGQRLAREIAGETELLSGTRRTLTVIAARDTEVARVPRALFARIVERNPACLMQLASSLARRLEAQYAPAQPATAAKRIIALVPQDGPGNDVADFAERLTRCLRTFGSAEMVLKANAADRTSHWYHRLETANDVVVYVADPRPSAWSRLCLRQSDCVLLLAGRDQDPRPWRTLGGPEEAPKPESCEIVLHGGAGADRPGSAARWLDLYPQARHHHVNGDADIARLARLLTGRATGVVLSGGGARGLAHIGALRALAESGIPVDSIGGTSIGAIVAALWATGMAYPDVVRCVRRTFVDVNPLNDFTMPLLSLVAGRKVGALLRHEFGETDIEDLAIPFYCLSANLTTGEAAIHRRGKLWLWLRASIAIPGVLPPVCTGRQIYVDGATINNLPIDVMRGSISGRVIGIDVGAEHVFESDVELTEVPQPWNLFSWLRGGRPRIGIMQVLWRAGMVNSAAMTLGQRASADLLLKPPVGQIDMLDWKAFDRVVDIGYRHAMECLERRTQDAAAPAPDA
jgi:NTE family protein